MSSVVDFIGADSIAQLFDLHKLNNWRILRKNEQGNTIPIAEDIKSRSPAQAKNSFLEWSRIILAGNPKNNKIYDIELFNFSEVEEEEGSINRKRTQKVRFNFQLVASNEFGQAQPYMYNNAVDINTALENERLKLKLEMLTEKIAQLEAEHYHDEEEEEEEENETDNNFLNAFLGAIFSKYNNQDKSAYMGSIEKEKVEQNEQKEEYQKRLTAALKILRKNDKKFLVHIEKLADISEKKPQMFNMLIGSLDSMSL